MNWRDHILNEFAPGVSRLTLVADPHELLLEEGILAEIQARGFEMIPFEDHVAFRYAYESRFRSHWDRGAKTDRAVVVRLASDNLDRLPNDLLQTGHRVHLALDTIFPNLSSSVVAALDRADFDALYQAQQHYRPGVLGENDTKDFVLRHVFGIAPELIKTPEDLLLNLLRRHYGRQRIPPVLDERLIQLLRQHPNFSDWPLERIVPDAQAFFAFLQERWPVFLDRLAALGEENAQEPAPDYAFALPGPVNLPFDHQDIRVYLDNLFSEGILQPVAHKDAQKLAHTWASCGIRISPAEDRRRRLEKLLQSMRQELPSDRDHHRRWLHFARFWAEALAVAMRERDLEREFHPLLDELRKQVDRAFTSWVLARYAGLFNLPPRPPAMVHHIPRYLASVLEHEPEVRIALLLVDGLSLDQWVAAREEWQAMDSRWRFEEEAVFAWIPTITSVSRQAVFAGRPPIYFSRSIHTTREEKHLWAQFWAEQMEKHGRFELRRVAYLNVEGSRGDLDPIAETLANSGLQVLGLVIRKVDEIMHGERLGMAGMHSHVRQWIQEGFLDGLLELLWEHGFMIWLTSDHGNIEAQGIGCPREGVIADKRGQRVRVYSDPGLRARVQQRYPNSLPWDPIGLPEDYLALLAPPRAAFVQQGETIIAHGGISVEELIVPWVRIHGAGS